MRRDFHPQNPTCYSLSPSSCVPSTPDEREAAHARYRASVAALANERPAGEPTLAGFFGVVAVCLATAAIVAACIAIERWAAA